MDEDEERRQPTTNQPLNADRPRPAFGAALAVIGVLALIALVFFVVNWLRYST
jgi:hypothetical protein